MQIECRMLRVFLFMIGNILLFFLNENRDSRYPSLAEFKLFTITQAYLKGGPSDLVTKNLQKY